MNYESGEESFIDEAVELTNQRIKELNTLGAGQDQVILMSSLSLLVEQLKFGAQVQSEASQASNQISRYEQTTNTLNDKLKVILS